MRPGDIVGCNAARIRGDGSDACARGVARRHAQVCAALPGAQLRTGRQHRRHEDGAILRQARRGGEQGVKLGTPFNDAHPRQSCLGRNPYPWLQEAESIPLRYGDLSALKCRYCTRISPSGSRPAPSRPRWSRPPSGKTSGNDCRSRICEYQLS